MEIENFVDLESFLRDLVPFNGHKRLSATNEEYLRLLLSGFDARHIAIDRFRSRFDYETRASYPNYTSEQLEEHINNRIDSKANEIRTTITRYIKPCVEGLINSKLSRFQFNNRRIWHEVLIFLLEYYPKMSNQLNFEITLKGILDPTTLPQFLRIINQNTDNFLSVQGIEQEQEDSEEKDSVDQQKEDNDE